MQREQVKYLLDAIAVHYPSQKVNDNTIEEWYRLIGFMDFEECMDKLDEYLLQESGNRFAPTVGYFRKHRSGTCGEVFHSGKTFDRIDKFGNLTDEEGRIWAIEGTIEEKYHYEMGRIVDSQGRIVR